MFNVPLLTARRVEVKELEGGVDETGAPAMPRFLPRGCRDMPAGRFG